MSVRNLSPSFNRSSTSTYEMKTSCNPEKEMLISQLKSQLFEYEQNEKNFNQLQAKFRNVQNDLQLLSEDKLSLEYELKQKGESGSQQIGELKTENEDILNELNDKNAMNKKLYYDNNNLFRNLETTDIEIEALKEKIAEQEEMILKLGQEKTYCERQISSYNQAKEKDNRDIQDMEEKRAMLKQTSIEQSNMINNKKEQNDRCFQELDQERFENKNLVGKLRSKEENFALTQRQLQEANRTMVKLENDLNDLKKNYSRTSNDLTMMINNCSSEQGKRNQIEQNNEKLDQMLRDRLDEIKRVSNENEGIQMNIEKLCGDKERLGGELSQYKNHIRLLIDQNQKLGNELEAVLERDQKLNLILHRTQRSSGIVEQNRVVIENSLENLKQYLNNNHINGNSNNNKVNSSIDKSNSIEQQPKRSPNYSNHASQNYTNNIE